MTARAPAPRIRVKRLPERGHYDRETLTAILDAGFVCAVGYIFDGHPYVTPTAYWRTGAHVYWHGSSASRMLRTVGAGVDVCLTVTHLDGFVLARSAFHHSLNYRSVMLFGRAERLDDPAAKTQALEAFVERLFPGRWAELRPVTPQELTATTVLRMAITEGAAKIRTGPPKDDPADYAWPVWAGVLPVQGVLGAPIPDGQVAPTIREPEYLANLTQFGFRPGPGTPLQDGNGREPGRSGRSQRGGTSG